MRQLFIMLRQSVTEYPHTKTPRQQAAPDTAADAPVPKGMLRVATTMAVPAPLLAEFGLGLSDYEEPENTFPYATLGRLLGRCAKATRCRHFGLLVGQRAGISALGAVGFLMQSSPDVRTALGIAARNRRIHNPSSAVEQVEDDSSTTLSYIILRPGLYHRDQLLDMAVAIECNVMPATPKRVFPQPHETLI